MHAGALRSLAVLAAASDVDAGRLAAFAQEHGSARPMADSTTYSGRPGRTWCTSVRRRMPITGRRWPACGRG